jgi:hypothetical protein
MNYRDPFSKFMDNIKFECYLREDSKHDIESLWIDIKSGTQYAFYKYSGLRAITNNLYYKLIKDFGINITKPILINNTTKEPYINLNNVSIDTVVEYFNIRKSFFNSQDKQAINLLIDWYYKHK